MATFIPGVFTKVQWASQEELDGAATFSEMNKIFLISLRGEYAEKKLSLVLDPTKLHEFLAEAAFLSGQLALLDFLIGDEPQ